MDVKVGDRLEFERFPGQRDRGTVVSIDLGAPPKVTAVTLMQDRDNQRYALTMMASRNVVKLTGAAAPATHSAMAMRPRAPCPQQAAHPDANASHELVRALIICRLEDATGVYAGRTINLDVLSFQMGRTFKNRNAPVSLRYADPNATLHNATVRYNQRIYDSTDVTHWDGVERNFTVYVDLNNRWAVGWSVINDGQMRRTALPR